MHMSERKYFSRLSYWQGTALCVLSAVSGACGAHSDPSTVQRTSQSLSLAGTITDFTGLCLVVQGGNTGRGTPIQLSTCDGSAGQQWTYDGSSFVGAAGKCLDVSGGNTDNGTLVQLWNCNGSAAQQWTQQNGQLLGPGGKCLDVNGFFNSVPGQTMDIMGLHRRPG